MTLYTRSRPGRPEAQTTQGVPRGFCPFAHIFPWVSLWGNALGEVDATQSQLHGTLSFCQACDRLATSTSSSKACMCKRGTTDHSRDRSVRSLLNAMRGMHVFLLQPDEGFFWIRMGRSCQKVDPYTRNSVNFFTLFAQVFGSCRCISVELAMTSHGQK